MNIEMTVLFSACFIMTINDLGRQSSRYLSSKDMIMGGFEMHHERGSEMLQSLTEIMEDEFG